MSCTRCGACCTRFGVCIMPSDIARISIATGIQPSHFVDIVEDYQWRERKEPALLIEGEKRIIVLKRSKENVCLFYSSEGCRIYRHRPLLCRTYPFKKNMESVLSRACSFAWFPKGREKEEYEHAIIRYESELAEFHKLAEEWNSKGGGTLSELFTLILKP